MFIDAARPMQSSSVRSGMHAGKEHATPKGLKLSCYCAFYKHAAPTALNAVAALAMLPIGFCCLTSCASVSHHQFSEPAAGWHTKTGQLMYRTAKTTLIGEAVVRFSKTGDFELTVSKGPGITLLSLRQDSGFAEFNANFTDQRWSGPTAQAPPQLHGWLELRDQFLRAPNQKTLRYVAGNETFLFRF
jgi:hypothetical protein